MFDFNASQRNVFIAVSVLALAATGYGVRRNSAPPPVAFSTNRSTPPAGLPAASQGQGVSRMRSGGASLPETERPAPRLLVVHVAGAVRKPGVYALPNGKRTMDAVRAAGGPARGADLDALNLAALLGDGQQIMVPRRGAGSRAGRTTSRRSSFTPAGIVAVNTASAEELDALPGVGPATAQKILEYRSQNGPFTSPDDLLNVKGIGPKKLERMRPYLSVQ